MRVVVALIDSGQAHTPNDLVRDSAALSNAHDLANTAPLVAVLGAMVVTFGVFRARAVSRRIAAIAVVLNTPRCVLADRGSPRLSVVPVAQPLTLTTRF